MNTALLLVTLLFLAAAASQGPADAGNDLDLTGAVVVTPPGLKGPEERAVRMLIEEVEERTRVRWQRATTWPDDSVPVVAIGPAAGNSRLRGRYAPDLAGTRAPEGREGYQLRVRTGRGAPAVFVLGNDSRGILFGAGRLLRTLRMGRDRVRLPARLDLATAPHYPLRGHQLGYRPKTNSYDGWTPEMWEQYVRDLVVFGSNAVELIPPRSDDAADSPHFPLPPMEMMVRMSRLLDEYGLDVWIWYPALDPDYSDPRTVETALKEWEVVFRQLPRIDSVFVPGGDPGHTPPKVLMPFLEKQAASLRRHHPKAQLWVAPQGFSAEWLADFLEILRGEPSWLTGVVFGPQIRVSIHRLRELVPRRYPLRHYPDITHSRQCQFPVPDWDLAYALTEAREGINPRPRQMARIFAHTQPATVGFLTYSEGCNDDVNKAVWSALGWDPGARVEEILREYSRCFLGESYEERFAEALLALERNWVGPLAANEGVYATLKQFQEMERAAAPKERLNWRFQQGLYRAYYDAYVRARLIHETALEQEAMERLRRARQVGAAAAMSEAEEVLRRATSQPVAQEWRARVFELAEALFQSIRMQLSVPRYQAIDVGRGANLDTIDLPLNNRLWLEARFTALRGSGSEAERLAGIDEILNWTNPGPGGFYDDLGSLTAQPRLLRGKGFEQDPDFRESSLVGSSNQGAGRISWYRNAESLYDAPLQLRYEGLDPAARYRVRVVYAGDSPTRRIRLAAGGVEIHPLMDKPAPLRPLEYDLPAETTRGGSLTLTWTREAGLGANGRGCQVAEVWLLRH